MATEPAPSARRPRGKAILLAIIALAGGLALVSATQTWVTISLAEGAAATGQLAVTGQQLNPSLSPIAIAALASVLALTIAGPVFRRVLGVLVALLGAGILALGVIASANPLGESESSVGEVTGIVGDVQGALIDSVSTTAWPWLASASGAVLIVAGVCVLLLAGRWRAGGRRYEAAAEHAGTPSDDDSGGGVEGDERDRISDWDAMSRGDDPT